MSFDRKISLFLHRRSIAPVSRWGTSPVNFGMIALWRDVSPGDVSRREQALRMKYASISQHGPCWQSIARGESFCEQGEASETTLNRSYFRNYLFQGGSNPCNSINFSTLRSYPRRGLSGLQRHILTYRWAVHSGRPFGVERLIFKMGNCVSMAPQVGLSLAFHSGALRVVVHTDLKASCVAFPKSERVTHNIACFI